MISGYETYSHSRRKLISPTWRLARLFVLFAVLYFLVTGLIVFTARVGSVSMEPVLSPGERVVASPLAFGVPLPFGSLEIRQYRAPRRGDLVVFAGPAPAEVPWGRDVLGHMVRFLTLQRRGATPVLQIKRVIGVPGDTIELEDMIARVRPADHVGFQLETEIVPVEYSINTRIAAESWDGDLPFSGDLAAVTLAEGEFFLLGDNRSYSSDSRAWGPVSIDAIRGKVVLRYWPLRRFGRP